MSHQPSTSSPAASAFDRSWHLDETLRRGAKLVSSSRDILAGRVSDVEPPSWLESRGWTDFFASLSDEQLVRAEQGQLPSIVLSCSDAPSSLADFVREVQRSVQVPRRVEAVSLDVRQMQAISARKRQQLSSILAVAAPLAQDVSRVVDVAAGRGHLTRLAAQAWNTQSVGIEREASYLDAARRLARDRSVSFRRLDAFREPLDVHSDDLVVGLHACGEVGDVLIEQAAEAQASVFLVSCCLQKVRADHRTALSSLGKQLGLRIPRGVLGLANLTPRPQGVEASMVDTMQARTRRHALRILLMSRGHSLRVGEEMHKINRRRALGTWPDLAARALAVHGEDPPSENELQASLELARKQFPLIRRWSLARNLLARPLEVAIVLDRAMYLQEHGQRVHVATIFDPDISPRNLAIFTS